METIICFSTAPYVTPSTRADQLQRPSSLCTTPYVFLPRFVLGPPAVGRRELESRLQRLGIVPHRIRGGRVRRHVPLGAKLAGRVPEAPTGPFKVLCPSQSPSRSAAGSSKILINCIRCLQSKTQEPAVVDLLTVLFYLTQRVSCNHQYAICVDPRVRLCPLPPTGHDGP